MNGSFEVDMTQLSLSECRLSSPSARVSVVGVHGHQYVIPGSVCGRVTAGGRRGRHQPATEHVLQGVSELDVEQRVDCVVG